MQSGTWRKSAHDCAGLYTQHLLQRTTSLLMLWPFCEFKALDSGSSFHIERTEACHRCPMLCFPPCLPPCLVQGAPLFGLLHCAKKRRLSSAPSKAVRPARNPTVAAKRGAVWSSTEETSAPCSIRDRKMALNRGARRPRCHLLFKSMLQRLRLRFHPKSQN